MNTETTINQLEGQLKLKGMAQHLRAILEMPLHNRPGLELALAEMVEAELFYRKEQRTAKLLKASKLRFKSPLEEVLCSNERNLSKDTISSLATCDYILQGRHIIITGKAGCGKTWLSCALGRQACMLGHKVIFYNIVKLAEEIALANLTGGYLKFIEKLMKNDLIILDDFGLRAMDEYLRIALYQLLDGDRDDYKTSIIITSQLATKDWYKYLNPGSQTESILDRLLNSASIINLEGKSLRKSKNISTFIP